MALYAALGCTPLQDFAGFLGVFWHRPGAREDLVSHSCQSELQFVAA